MLDAILGHTDPKMTDRYAEYSTSSLKIALDNIVKMSDNKSYRKQTGDLKKKG
jgi:hypothetical protein